MTSIISSTEKRSGDVAISGDISFAHQLFVVLDYRKCRKHDAPDDTGDVTRREHKQVVSEVVEAEGSGAKNPFKSGLVLKTLNQKLNADSVADTKHIGKRYSLWEMEIGPRKCP